MIFPVEREEGTFIREGVFQRGYTFKVNCDEREYRFRVEFLVEPALLPAKLVRGHRAILFLEVTVHTVQPHQVLLIWNQHLSHTELCGETIVKYLPNI